MEPPTDTQTIVDIPIETQSDLANDAALIQLDPDTLDDEARDPGPRQSRDLERVAG